MLNVHFMHIFMSSKYYKYKVSIFMLMNMKLIQSLFFFKSKVAAQAGQNVTIVDIKPELLDKAIKSIQNNLTRVGKKMYKDDTAKIENFVKDSFNRIQVSTKIEDGVNADLIIEAIVEKLDVKQELFNKLDQVILLYSAQ